MQRWRAPAPPPRATPTLASTGSIRACSRSRTILALSLLALCSLCSGMIHTTTVKARHATEPRVLFFIQAPASDALTALWHAISCASSARSRDGFPLATTLTTRPSPPSARAIPARADGSSCLPSRPASARCT